MNKEDRAELCLKLLACLSDDDLILVERFRDQRERIMKLRDVLRDEYLRSIDDGA